MMRLNYATTALSLVLALASIGCAQQSGSVVAKVEPSSSPSIAVPARVDNFRLVEAGGKAFELYRLKDATAVVIVMHGSGQPEIAALEPELSRLQSAYKDKGVEFVLVNSSGLDTREKLQADVLRTSLNLPLLDDANQLVGEQLGATRYGQAFVVNPKTWAIAYNGPLSTDAIDAVVADKPFASTSAAVNGALINFPARHAAAKGEFARISYSDTIAPMIEDKCIACHQQGGIAPFAFDSYNQVKAFSPMIREAVRTDRMPPWDADPHTGNFADDKSLSADQIKTLVHWIEAGSPRGEGVDKLAAVKHVRPEWPLGKPDLVVDIPSYSIPATGIVDYQYPKVANPLKEGRWVKAYDASVTTPRGVHHILSTVIPPGQDENMMGYGSSVGGYVPGSTAWQAPKGMGTYLAPGGKLGFQMHYTPFGQEALSQQKVGLYFYKEGEKPKYWMRESALHDLSIEIPPNAAAHEEVAYFNFPKEAVLHSVIIHAHYRGTYSKLELLKPSGERTLLINVPYYDFNWQRDYEFEKPVSIPAGSKLVATYIYDNSKRNPMNPDPNATVRWGDQSFEEMFYTQMRYRWVDETVDNPKDYDALLERTRLMGMYDDNLDDKIQVFELRGEFKQKMGSPRAFGMVDKNNDGGIDVDELESAMAKWIE